MLAISGRSTFWTAPGDTALRTLVGWNIEIMLMFAIAGIWLIFVFGYFGFFAAINLVLGMKRGRGKGRGRRGSSAGSSRGDNSRGGARERTRRKARVIGIIYAVPVVMNVFGFAVMGWRY